MQVTVRNAGETAAKGVRVSVVLPDGIEVDLKGPAELKRNQKSVYKASGFEHVSSSKKMKAKVSCSNCRN